MQQIQQPVQWFEGMLLSPQHFQQNNSYFENLIFHQLQRVTPYYFGAIELKFDQTAIADQKLLVETIHAVMTDGTVVDYALNDNDEPQVPNACESNLLSYDLANIEGINPQTPFYIYLAIAKQNLASSSGSDATMKRYDSINAGKVMDLNDYQNQIDLVRLRPKLQLLMESELSPNYSYFPIAKLKQNHDGSYHSIPYTPPLLLVNSSKSESPAGSVLGEKVEFLITSLRNKATEQRNYFVEKQGNSGPISHIQKLNLHHISQFLPGLEVMLKGQRCHPYELYLSLVNLASGMAILLDDVLPPIYPAYNHQDLDSTFAPVLNNIYRIIKKLELNFEVTGLSAKEQGVFSCKYSNEANHHQMMLSFRIGSGVSRESLILWIENSYICTEDKREQLLIERITGCKRKQVNEFVDIKLEENDEEVFFIVDVDKEYFTDGEDLSITSSDEQLDKYSPMAINWYKLNQENNEEK